MFGILVGVSGSVLGTDPVMPKEGLDQLDLALQKPTHGFFIIKSVINPRARLAWMPIVL
jgi:hypothetical protein